MKKKLMMLFIIISIISASVFSWRVAYSIHKSTDNLPTLAAIAEMSESEVNSLLPGYKISQLKSVWGEPDTTDANIVCWEIGDMTLIVNYKNNGVAAICGLKDSAGKSVGEN